MVEMARYPFMVHRKGSQNLSYKRAVPVSLHAKGRPKQIWKSLKTPDRNAAGKIYAGIHAETENLFESWRLEDARANGAPHPAVESVSSNATPVVPLTPALLKRWADAHYNQLYETDFAWRGDLWKRAKQDEAAFWRGDIVALPTDDTYILKGHPLSYYSHLIDIEAPLENVVLYCAYKVREKRLKDLRRLYQLGDVTSSEASALAILEAQGVTLSDADWRRLLRKLAEIEIGLLEELVAHDAASVAGLSDREATQEAPVQPQTLPSQPGALASTLVEQYLAETAREREWPKKTTMRKRGELNEFLAIVGDKPINAYTRDDGVLFKTIQLDLPAYRGRVPFKGLSLTDAARKAKELRSSGKDCGELKPVTINDKIGTTSLFFRWLKLRDGSVVDPVGDLGMRRPKARHRRKKNYPWTVEELNKMFAAPIYTGCKSAYYWGRPGDLILNQSAMFWVPLIGLFSGMRLGEIIQMQTADVRSRDDIQYFDVTPLSAAEMAEDDDAERKSVKTSSSHREIPIHKTLFDVGFADFLAYRQKSGELRLFPDFEKTKADDSWSKTFSKHFKRFCTSIDVTRRGVTFHSLRHNVEDALRNTDVRKEARDAVQGHGENGVSREYGTGYYLTTLNDAVQKIEYKGLKLPGRKID
jgi:integrase